MFWFYSPADFMTLWGSTALMVCVCVCVCIYIYIYIYIYVHSQVFLTRLACVALSREYFEFWFINLHFIYNIICGKKLTSGISNITVNFIGENALKPAEGCVQ